jgi:hypothetical protein
MRTSDVLKGLGVVGAALSAWYLLEPGKGSRRRRKLVRLSRDVYNGAGQELGRIGSEIGRIGEDVGKSFTSIVDRVGEMTGLAASSEASTSSGRSRGSRRSSSSSNSSSSGGRRRSRSHAHTNGESNHQHA